MVFGYATFRKPRGMVEPHNRECFICGAHYSNYPMVEVPGKCRSLPESQPCRNSRPLFSCAYRKSLVLHLGFSVSCLCAITCPSFIFRAYFSLLFGFLL